MMRRAFSLFAGRLLKSKDDELKSTLKYLTKGSMKSLGSLFGSSAPSEHGMSSHPGISKKNIQSHHVENILRILNSNLPEVESKKQKVAIHYDVLFSHLRSIVTEAVENEDTSSKQLRTASPEDLYDKLLLLQYMGKLTNVRQITEILLSKNFNKFDDLWEHRALFDQYQRVVISILLYYRTHNAQIRKEYEVRWLSDYNDLQFPLRRLFWRCLTFDVPEDSIKQTISNNVKLLGKNWRNNDLILIYQSLYEKSHILPESKDLEGVSGGAVSFTRNQTLLFRILRAISKRFEDDPKLIKKWLIDIVKLSVQNKLVLESLTPSSASIIDQYKFIRSLDVSIQSIHRRCQSQSTFEELQDDLENILKSINDEEHELKTHLPLNLI
ncbi:Smt1p SKDI_10G0700 [Saccharomyces kudriavzevii IFO 1802]|uniref:Uncharacterized protein n=2 Tax=Saccharomyces kudriavzevii (strain ATCC MYA-4449 / AS 2.2408 / CBS 8840 / NBRC 1802 / NCYC 2889) TaxID=226230 RepID=A0AA35J1Q4_SACK1|nr:uncharacterized protein SKDI_10G0700 [Saccharomyces kudriavzevii IFO 1802]EJT43888.1 YJL147C-like protein [Saccharomyces kudriavzevii IFO 1802]CAI4043544.1 hypothetical protein SKDI_10G0700 [Saccharomyces kudriavzevii IFO 1802]